MHARASSLLPEVKAIVLAAGELLHEHHARPRAVRLKGRIDLVTATDVAVEEFLKERLGACLPEADMLAEESASRLTPPECCWIIDPVDGTTNFAHGLPLVGISVGLWHRGEILLGVVNVPLIGECFSAVRGQGAFCNGVRLAVTGTDRLEEALVATGFPYEMEEELDGVLHRMRQVLPRTRGLRRCGAASVDLAWLASGRFDAFYENRLKPWDVAAGWLLVEEAGGLLTNFDGSPFSITGGEVLASNGKLHRAMSELIGCGT